MSTTEGISTGRRPFIDIRHWREELNRLQLHLSRCKAYIQSESWTAANRRRGDLIDKQIASSLTPAEAGEFEGLTLIADIVVDAGIFPSKWEGLQDMQGKLIDSLCKQIDELLETRDQSGNPCRRQCPQCSGPNLHTMGYAIDDPLERVVWECGGCGYQERGCSRREWLARNCS